MIFAEDNDDLLLELRSMYYPDIADQSHISGLLHEMSLCTFIADITDKRFMFSAGMVDLIGKVASQDMLLEAFGQYICDKDREAALDNYKKAFAKLGTDKKRVISFEHSLRQSFNEILWVCVYMQRVDTEEGACVFGLIQDKTKTMSERILSQLLFDGINEFIFYFDSVTDICYFNTHMMKALDLRHHYIEHASSEIFKIIHPDDHASFVSSLEAFLQHRSDAQSADFRLLSPTRGEIWVHPSGASDLDITGSTRYITGLLIDITDKKKSESLQKNIIEGTSAIVFTADTKRNEIIFSENLHQLFPEAPLEVSGNILDILSDMILPEDRMRFREPIDEMVNGETDRYSVEFRINKGDGKTVWLASRGKAFFDSSKQSQMIVGTIFDLSSMNEVRELVEKTSFLHEISGLPTRGRLLIDTEKVIHDRNVLSAAIILVDIKGFHTYNDRFGRATGDDILLGLGKALEERLPSGGNIYHIGIDMFCILWPHSTRVQVERFMEYMQEETIHPLIVGKDAVYVSFAMSAALFPSCGSTADELLVNAEITLHKVKQDKRKKYAIYCPTDKRELKERLDFEFQLSRSIRNGKDNFQVHYQPLVDAAKGKLVGAEALLRWISPGNEDVRPEKVIAALEATGQMETIGRWVLEQAICQCGQWLDAGVDENFFIHVNVTAEDLARPNYSDGVIDLLSKYSLNPKNIILEITETSLMRNIATCRQNLNRLRNAGVRIALDDFGTGYSSLNYLRELPIDEIKIDRVFIEDIQRDRFNHSFISAIVLLAHSISKLVCVEGIETKEKEQAVKELNADILQGFYFGKPMDAKEFETSQFRKSTREKHVISQSAGNSI